MKDRTGTMILLAHTSGSKKIAKKIRKNRIKNWLFLCRDYRQLMLFEEAIGDTASRIFTGSRLDTKAHQLRGPVKKIFKELAEQYHSVEWWATKLSEKNTLVNNLFLHICYLSIANDVIMKHKDICIISDSRALLKSVRDMYPAALFAGSFPLLADYVKKVIRPLAYFTYFVFKSILKGLLAKMYSRKLDGNDLDKTKKSILLFTWVDEKYFGNGEKNNDRYFTILPDWLKRKGYEVIIFPKLYNIERTYKEASRWFKLNGGKFLLEHNYYRLSDYLYPVKVYLRRRKLKIKFKNLYLAGLKVDRLFYEHNQTGYSYDSVLHYRLVKRMAENGIVPDIYVDFYENMLPEKLFRLGMRKYCPHSRIITYQHAPFFPNLLCMYMTGRELECAPDKLVCSGRAMMDIIKNEGFPPERVVLGPALRYGFLHAVKPWKTNARDRDCRKVVLVIFPLERKLAEELMTKVFSVLRELEDIKVILKIHPMMHSRIIIDFCRTNKWKLPAHFQFCNDELYSLIEQVDCALIMATTSILEFCVLEIPYINVGSEIALNHDPTEWFAQCRHPLYTDNEIKTELIKILKGEAQSYDGLIKEDVFEPVNEHSLQAFITD